VAVTFWGRRSNRETLDAQAFLKQNGYAADHVLDLDKTPPTAAQWEQLRKGLGELAAAVDTHWPEAMQAPRDDAAALVAWLSADPRRIRAPLLLTPKGAVAGFREQRWRSFLDIGKGR